MWRISFQLFPYVLAGPSCFCYPALEGPREAANLGSPLIISAAQIR